MNIVSSLSVLMLKVKLRNLTTSFRCVVLRTVLGAGAGQGGLLVSVLEWDPVLAWFILTTRANPRNGRRGPASILMSVTPAPELSSH